MAAETTEKQSFFQRNKKTIIIAGVITLAALLFIPDVYLRKYVPWVK
jgi:hypothetical protein